MNPRLHIADEDLALYATGALPDAEMAAARAHVEQCARCKEELRQTGIALAAYAQTTPETDLTAGAKQRFMARVARNENPATVANQKPALAVKPSREGWFGRWAPALAVAFALLFVAVSYDDLRKRAQIAPLLSELQNEKINEAQFNQLMELLTSPRTQHVALHEKPAHSPPPEGRVVYSPRNGKLLLTAQNMRPLPAGKVYELWVLQENGGKPLPAGTFTPDSRGNAAMILAEAPANLPMPGFAITVENEGGAQTPTLPTVISGW